MSPTLSFGPRSPVVFHGHASPVRRMGASRTGGRRSLRASAQCSSNGKCWLVGAGPGSADLLTIRAARLLKTADVILYDELGAQDILDDFAKSEAERVYVGKRGGRQSILQSEINKILVTKCKEGKGVVRLKGGCPSVFSRCREELIALSTAGIEVEMVPGVSSALAAPVLAGFPLTEKDVGRHFVVFSAHSKVDLDWSALSAIDTLVILMGGSRLAEIVNALVSAGRDFSTKVAIIKYAGTPSQEQWFGTLEDIATVVDGISLSPCIIVVGEVARQ